MPARTVKSRSRKPVKKKSRKPVKKKSRKPVKKKSRKPVKKKSRKPVKKKSRKRKSKFKVGSRSRSTKSVKHKNMRQASERREGRRQRQQRVRDSVKHKNMRQASERREGRRQRQQRVRDSDRHRNMRRASERREGQRRRQQRVREVRKKTNIPSLFELAAQKLPHTSEWAHGSNLHLKDLVREPQQKGLKKIMGADLIKPTLTSEAFIEKLTDDEIETLTNMYVDREGGSVLRRILTGFRSIPSRDIRLTLRNLQEIPEDHVPNQFFHSYSDRLHEARANYMRKLRENLQEVKDDIQEAKNEYESTHDEPFDFERDYDVTDLDGRIHRGTIGARITRQFLDKLALDNYIRSLEISENYRNDLYNYAYSLIIGLIKFGDNDWIYSDEEPGVD
jgi:hypothetical protein